MPTVRPRPGQLSARSVVAPVTSEAVSTEGRHGHDKEAPIEGVRMPGHVPVTDRHGLRTDGGRKANDDSAGKMLTWSPASSCWR